MKRNFGRGLISPFCFPLFLLDTSALPSYTFGTFLLRLLFTVFPVLVIRLSRTGRSKIPTYRIVVAEKSAAVKGRYHEAVGYFNPASETPKPTYDRERIQYWISQGARPSETLARLLAKEGFAGMEKFYDVNKKYQKKSKKGEAGETGEAGEVGEKGEAGEAKKAKGAEAPVAQGKPAEEAPASETETKKA